MATSRACRFCVAVLLCATTLQGWAAVTDRAERRQQAREVRQETRQGARQTKQDCRHADQKSNAGCRQDKRHTKQQGRERARDIKY
ncbi:hypothetical protein ACIPZ5_09080 [Pseudomonas sp. NPDC089428]|uniref:hypothetical protein n=1 Tax=Pseudomonas TaxID=286 RepID=UPI001B0C6CE1|nr:MULTISPECIES: hypothetical protein [unclassified Pseudomonas]MBO9547941.1 hypothetical protein [Pseudomonas sp.]BDM23397.1 hypothetical protein KMS_R31540 [Pseudomonas sp. LRP2-20]